YATCSPSGEKQASTPLGIGNCVGMPPFVETVNNWEYRLVNTFRGDEKSTADPSGVQPRATSGPGWVVNRFGGPPVTGMVKTSTFPSYWALKAMVCPSGEKTGFSSTPISLVRRRGFLPSRSATQRSSA